MSPLLWTEPLSAAARVPSCSDTSSSREEGFTLAQCEGVTGHSRWGVTVAGVRHPQEAQLSAAAQIAVFLFSPGPQPRPWPRPWGHLCGAGLPSLVSCHNLEAPSPA